jgi:DNA-binding transcriptional MerR regulator
MAMELKGTADARFDTLAAPTEKRLSIKEFSAFTGVTQSALRYYDGIGLFSPLHRSKSGYRYYSPEQLMTINLITVLSSLGIPLETLKELMEHRCPERILDLLDDQEEVIDQQLRQLRDSQEILHTFRNLIKAGLKEPAQAYSVGVVEAKEARIVFGPPSTAGDSYSFNFEFIRFCAEAPKRRINLNFPIGAYHHSAASFFARPTRPECLFSIDPSGNATREAGRYLVGYCRGYYGEFGDLPARMQDFADENHVSLAGPAYSIYLHDEVTMKDPDQYLAQISIKLAD